MCARVKWVNPIRSFSSNKQKKKTKLSVRLLMQQSTMIDCSQTSLANILVVGLRCTKKYKCASVKIFVVGKFVTE